MLSADITGPEHLDPQVDEAADVWGDGYGKLMYTHTNKN